MHAWKTWKSKFDVMIWVCAATVHGVSTFSVLEGGILLKIWSLAY